MRRLGWAAATLLFLALAVLLLTGCETIQYDNDVASCSTANGKIEVSISESRDSDQTRQDTLTPEFLAACKAIGSKR